MNIVKGMDLVSRTVRNYITVENQPDGLLSDVESIIQFQDTDQPIDEPCVWIVQHPTVKAANYKDNLSRIKYLQTTFEFVCISADTEYDFDKSLLKGQDLACRVGQSVMKNFTHNTLCDEDKDLPGRVFIKLDFNTLYPSGEVSIQGKSSKIPATSIVFDFIHEIDWLSCR